MRMYSYRAEIQVRHADPEEAERVVQFLLDDGLRGLESSGDDRFIVFADVQSVEELAGPGPVGADSRGRPSPS